MSEEQETTRLTAIPPQQQNQNQEATFLLELRKEVSRWMKEVRELVAEIQDQLMAGALVQQKLDMQVKALSDADALNDRKFQALEQRVVHLEMLETTRITLEGERAREQSKQEVPKQYGLITSTIITSAVSLLTVSIGGIFLLSWAKGIIEAAMVTKATP